MVSWRQRYPELAREYERTRKPTPSKMTTCRDCGKPVWRVKTKPRDYQPRCLECKGPWTLEKRRQLNDEREARKRSQTAEKVDRLKVYERDGWRCYLCGKKVNRRLKWPHPRSVSLDHVIPIRHGGEHSYANTRCAHLRCNLVKSCRGGGEQLALL